MPRYRAQAEIDEQTALGDAYVRSLMRSQLRAGMSAFAVLALVAGTLPLAFAALSQRAVVWVVLGFAAYPLLTLLGWWYVRRAERNERDFARLVKGRPPP
ncbi:membrane protein [Streptomyces sp. AcH 505]|nr:membrane protein [Streptomyces sp. AcH 505]